MSVNVNPSPAAPVKAAKPAKNVKPAKPVKAANGRQAGRIRAVIARLPSDNDVKILTANVMGGGLTGVDTLAPADARIVGTIAVAIARGMSADTIARILVISAVVSDGIKAFRDDRTSSLTKHVPSAARYGIKATIRL